MRPIAPLARELRLEGGGFVALGLAGLAAALIAGASPARTLIPFAVAALALGAVQAAIGYRWYVATAREAGDPGDDAAIETASDTRRRTAVKLAVPLIVIVMMLLVSRELGAIAGGLWAGIGVVDLYTGRWADRQAAEGRTIFRELGTWPFASGRRPLYVLMSDSTEAT